MCGSAGVKIEEPDMRKLRGSGDEGVEGFGRHDGGIYGSRQGECVYGDEETRIPGVDEAIEGRSYE